MTNYEKIKAMTKEEMAEFLEKVVFNIGNKWCEELCDFRKNKRCSIPDDKACPYMDDKLVIEKWLGVEK